MLVLRPGFVIGNSINEMVIGVTLGTPRVEFTKNVPLLVLFKFILCRSSFLLLIIGWIVGCGIISCPTFIFISIIIYKYI